MSQLPLEPVVLYAEQGAVAVVTLNRPLALNSFTRQMHRELWVALDRVEANPVIRALVITGAGRGFCAGADLAEFDFEPGPDLAVRIDPGPVIDQAFSKIGLIPDAGGTWFLTQRVGLTRALGLALTGDKLSAAQAREWGMIWDVADDCLGAALQLAERLAAMPTQALVATRHALRDSTSRTLNQQLDVERDTQSAMGKTADFIEGVMAFREKRPPHFKGC